MGGQSSTTHTQQSQTAPWEAAKPLLQGVLGQLSAGYTGFTAGALNTLQAGNPYAGQIGGYAPPLLSAAAQAMEEE